MTATPQSTTGYLDVNGGQIYYEVLGEGHPLVLVHAGVADSTMWDDQFGEFANHYRVIRYDTRAFGKSRTEDVEFSNRQDLHELLNHLAVDKAFLIGVSRGGQIVVDYTLEHPEKVAAVVPVAAGLSGLNAEPTEQEKAYFNEMEAAFEKDDFERAAELDVQVWADGPGQPAGRAPEQVRERVRQMCLNTYRTHIIEGKPVPMEPPAAGRLGEIKVPTLVIVGDLDTSGVEEACKILARDIKGAEKVVIPGTAHMVPMEKPAEFNKAVLDFLSRIAI